MSALGLELKDLSQDLTYFGLGDGDSLQVEHKAPLRPGHFRFQIYKAKNVNDEVCAAVPAPSAFPPRTPTEQQAAKGAAAQAKDAPAASPAAPPLAPAVPTAPAAPAAPAAPGAPAPSVPGEDSRFALLGELVVDADWDIETLKDAVYNRFGGKDTPFALRAPKPQLMRLREKANGRLTRALTSGKTLKDNVKAIRDGKALVVQRTLMPEKITDTTLLINLRWWHPIEQRLGSTQEVAFCQTMKVQTDLKQKLSEASRIPVEHIRICRPFVWKLKDLENMPGLGWDETGITAETTLVDKPWRLRNGDCLVYKDNREPEREIKVPETGVAALLDPSRTQPRAQEVGVRIYTPKEQKERERARQAKAKEAKEKEAKEKEAADKAEAEAEANASANAAEDASQEESAGNAGSNDNATPA